MTDYRQIRRHVKTYYATFLVTNYSPSTRVNSIADSESANTISVVHTNLVAPVIIKNCLEEFQHVSDLQEPVVYGRPSENSGVEHPLIQVHKHTRTHAHTHTHRDDNTSKTVVTCKIKHLQNICKNVLEMVKCKIKH